MSPIVSSLTRLSFFARFVVPTTKLALLLAMISRPTRGWCDGSSSGTRTRGGIIVAVERDRDDAIVPRSASAVFSGERCRSGGERRDDAVISAGGAGGGGGWYGEPGWDGCCCGGGGCCGGGCRGICSTAGCSPYPCVRGSYIVGYCCACDGGSGS